MIRYRFPLVMALLIYLLQGPLIAQSPIAYSAPENSRASSLEEGKALFEKERFQEALALFQQAVKVDGGSAPARYWVGMAQYELEEYRKAVSSFKRTVELDRKWAFGYIGLGKSYLQIKYRRLDARHALRMAARLSPDDPEIQYHLGIAHMNPRKTDRILGGDRDGRNFFLKAAVLNPAHPDAYFQIGRCFERPESPEFEKAMAAYIAQFKVSTDHYDALSRFVYLALLAERYGLAVELLERTRDDLGESGSAIVQTLLTQFSTLSEDSKSRPDVLHGVFETYISLLDPEEEKVYRDLAHVAPPDELTSWKEAGGNERDARWHAFWNARDSNPATVTNERLVEHYRRVMYARYHFSQGQHPYDRRGEIYVRYGEPENRRGDVFIADRSAYQRPTVFDNAAVEAVREQNNQFGYQLRVDRGYLTIVLPDGVSEEEIGAVGGVLADGVSEEDLSAVGGVLADGIVASSADLALQSERKVMGAGYATESWVYARYGLELFFVDQFGGGRFEYPWGTLLTSQQEMVRQERFSPRRLAEELIAEAPEEYLHDLGGEPLEYAIDAVTFRADNGNTELDISYSIPVWQFGDATDGRGESTSLNHLITLRDSTMSPVFTHEFSFGPFDRPKRKMIASQIQVPVYTLPASAIAPTGQFMLAVQVRDEISRRIGVYRKPLTVADYSGEELLISDLKLSNGIAPSSVPGPFVRKRLNITPNPGRLYVRGRPVYVYYEVYNLGLDEENKSAYEVNYEITPAEWNESRTWSARRQRDMQTVVLSFTSEGYEAETGEYMALDSEELPAGEYVLTVSLNDQNAGRTVSKAVNFLVVGR